MGANTQEFPEDLDLGPQATGWTRSGWEVWGEGWAQPPSSYALQLRPELDFQDWTLGRLDCLGLVSRHEGVLGLSSSSGWGDPWTCCQDCSCWNWAWGGLCIGIGKFFLFSFLMVISSGAGTEQILFTAVHPTPKSAGTWEVPFSG